MQRFLALHKHTIITAWYIGLTAWFGFFLLSQKFLDFTQQLELGRQTGSVALIVFWLTLVPGMLKRFHFSGIFLPIRTMMMLFRRQLGITMYVLAVTHYGWVRLMPTLLFGGDLLALSPFELMGFTAFLLLTPVFITSNEWSVRTMGHAWRTVHALVYIVVWLLFAHVALQGSQWQAIGTLIVAILETSSLIWDKIHTPPVTAPITPPTSAS